MGHTYKMYGSHALDVWVTHIRCMGHTGAKDEEVKMASCKKSIPLALTSSTIYIFLEHLHSQKFLLTLFSACLFVCFPCFLGPRGPLGLPSLVSSSVRGRKNSGSAV